MERNLLDLRYSEDVQNEDNDHWHRSEVLVERGVYADAVFVGAGDVFGYDADQSYPLDEVTGNTTTRAKYAHQEPLQKPINPPYANALKRQQNNQPSKSY
ncbi:unnamed protein product [Peronospora belbahrii]|uniref:Uncharacterized protein n=3 Tax=Peronospora belbahrii TaxID=622444 RepID=A0AAU9KT87_9STRA|nr:unnamed protein product [Peronospora belbahrii]